MTSYVEYNVTLTPGQKDKLLKAYKKRSPTTIRLANEQLKRPHDKIFVTQRQVTHLENAKREGKGAQLQFSQTQMREYQGGFLGALLPVLGKVGAMALPWLTKAAAPLATGALSGLASWGVNKTLKSGSGLFSVPQDKVDKLIAYKSYLTKKQKEQILQALQTASGVQIQLTPKQRGRFLGTLLASIDVPMLLKVLSGRGLQVDPMTNRSTKSVYIPPQQKGKGEKREEKAYCSGKLSLQWNPTARRYLMNYPLFNTDLHQLVAALGIKNFRGVFSRDALPNRKYKNECGIVNLDDIQGPGTRWTAYRITKKENGYFDSFGLPMPEEVADYLGKNTIYSPDELQDRNSIFCGLWCIYFLFERQKGTPFLSLTPKKTWS